MERPNPTIHAVFRHDGYWCVVADNGMGFFVGYVMLPTDHPWHGLHYDAAAMLDVDVHGGLTWAGERDWIDWDGDGAPQGWYIGFDCGHYNDAPMPGSYMAQVIHSWPGTRHWTMEQVAEEVRHLAEQVARAAVEELPKRV